MTSKLNKAVLSAVLAVSMAFSSAAFAGSNDVVVDTNGNFVKNDFGNCVRTKWEAGTDKCAANPTKPVAVSKAAAPALADKSAAPTEKSRSYLVFFDFNKSNITTEAKDILKKVYDDSARKDGASVNVIGHTDRSGSDKYNLALSKRRAEAVKSELVGMGVPPSDIKTEAKGESQPLVATDDGVKEPQNRRAEVTFSYKK
jgi:OOP family OmpA-OmpF porin